MGDNNYTFGLSTFDMADLMAEEQRAKEAAIEQIAKMMAEHGINLNDIAAAMGD